MGESKFGEFLGACFGLFAGSWVVFWIVWGTVDFYGAIGFAIQCFMWVWAINVVVVPILSMLVAVLALPLGIIIWIVKAAKG